MLDATTFDALALTTLAAEPAFLVSVWKPFLLLIPFVPWAWLVSTVFDKHAARFYLPRENWNAAHLTIGVLAIAAAIAMPMQDESAFWAGWGVMVFLLAADVGAFVYITNRDERVPDEFRLRLDFSKLAAKRAAKDAARKQGTVALVIKSPDKSLVAAPSASTPEFEVRVAAEQLFIKGLEARASQVDIAPVAGAREPSYQVSYLVDGVRQAGETIPPATALKLMDFWKAAGKLDIADRRKKLVADVSVEQGTTKKKVRLTSSGTQAGMRLTMLFDPEAAVKRKLADLGMLEPQVQELKKIVADEHGVVLLAGPPDGGRTTTLYAVMRMHDAYTKNVQTVEIDQQDVVEGVRQNVHDPQTEGPEFSTLVRSILRRDPDVLGVAELPDANTAKEIARVDQERTRTYLCVKADNAAMALSVWFKAMGDNETAGKVLHGVLAQKLLRKLCTNCKVAYQPSPDMVKKLGLPPDRVKQLFKKGGQVLIKNKPETCPVCLGNGYSGQEGVFEVFYFTDEDRKLLKAGDLNSLKVELRKRGLPTLQQCALRKAVDGITSVEELMRITASETAGQPAAAAPAPAKAAAPTA